MSKGSAAAAAGTPALRRILTRAAMGDDRWFGSVRAPQSRASRSRGVGSLAATEDPKPEGPPIPGAAPQQQRSVCRRFRGPLPPRLRLRLRLTWTRNSGRVAMATPSASGFPVSFQREDLTPNPNYNTPSLRLAWGSPSSM